MHNVTLDELWAADPHRVALTLAILCAENMGDLPASLAEPLVALAAVEKWANRKAERVSLDLAYEGALLAASAFGGTTQSPAWRQRQSWITCAIAYLLGDLLDDLPPRRCIDALGKFYQCKDKPERLVFETIAFGPWPLTEPSAQDVITSTDDANMLVLWDRISERPDDAGKITADQLCRARREAIARGWRWESRVTMATCERITLANLWKEV